MEREKILETVGINLKPLKISSFPRKFMSAMVKVEGDKAQFKQLQVKNKNISNFKVFEKLIKFFNFLKSSLTSKTRYRK